MKDQWAGLDFTDAMGQRGISGSEVSPGSLDFPALEAVMESEG